MSVHKSHKLYSDVRSSCLSPYLEELSVYLGQKEAYASASETIKTLLHVEVNGMQIQRQVIPKHRDEKKWNPYWKQKPHR